LLTQPQNEYSICHPEGFSPKGLLRRFFADAQNDKKAKGKGLIPLVIDFKGLVAHKNIKKGGAGCLRTLQLAKNLVLALG
jgi:hypothetical protein